MLGLGAVSGQQVDFRLFTNKDGQEVEAKVLAVSQDRRTLRGELRSGQAFEMAINLLSLDDQQFLKRWIEESSGAPATKFLLEVTFTKKEETTERKRGNYYRFTVKNVTYAVAVRNKTGEPLEGGLVEYALIHEDGLNIARSDDGTPVNYIEKRNPKREIIQGSETLPDNLGFNFSHDFVTKAVSTDMVEMDGNKRFSSDDVLGVLARISDRNGEVIGIYRSSESKIRDITWESVAGDAPPPTAVAATDPESSAEGISPMTTQEKSSAGVEVRSLDALPEVLQKGDTLPGDQVPDVVGKRIVATAVIDIDTDRPDGVIVAHGGAEQGYAVFVFQSQLQLWVKKLMPNGRSVARKVKIPFADLPSGEFTVEARLGAKNLELWIDGQVVGEVGSLGLFGKQPREGLSVGYDSEQTAVGPAAANVPFRGEIRELRIEIGGE